MGDAKEDGKKKANGYCPSQTMKIQDALGQSIRDNLGRNGMSKALENIERKLISLDRF